MSCSNRVSFALIIPTINFTLIERHDGDSLRTLSQQGFIVHSRTHTR